MNKKISVIIPTFKRSEYLLRSIDSVLNQTYSNVEVVVVDDNVPDSTYRLETEIKMNKYKNYSNVLYIKNEKNMGGALARNQGINKAIGDYITFLDDDDIYLPNKIITQLTYMLENKLDMSFTDVRMHNLKDELVDYREHPYIKSHVNEELLKQHILHHLTPTATYMFKKEAISRIGGFIDVKMGQEFMLMIRTIESGMKIGYLSEAHVIQYLHDGERISIGKNKIFAEKELFNFKKSYFNLLSNKQRRYVKFRHHAVLAVVGLRSKERKIMMRNLLGALFVSPIDCFKEVLYQMKKINRYK